MNMRFVDPRLTDLRIPYVAIQLAWLVLLCFLTGLATWLPHALYGG
jgi:hypothetical protein